MSEKQPLHPATEYLVVRGMAAVRDKLARAEQKYGYRDGWLSPNWMSECRAKMYHHITKGDPLDVIAYCLFLWHHGAPTCRLGFHVELLDQFDVVLDRRDLFDFARSAIEHALREPRYDGVGIDSAWYLDESTRRTQELVDKFANRVAPVDEIHSHSKGNAGDVEGQASVIDLVKALFIENPAGELGPSDEPESQYRDGYNAALEDVLAALESPAAANLARAAHAHEYVCVGHFINTAPNDRRELHPHFEHVDAKYLRDGDVVPLYAKQDELLGASVAGSRGEHADR
ncbi:hypothetical protein ABXK61_16105 [Burkholderia sola]|uniref:hypothetical protein n=1 Tax=Burkholderia TaxID=32008 RepID=UPI001AE5B76A|nr:hypothetical protein [Burkholderia sp. AcTa6-5]MBP0714830.1 hypothetical protein [Burkholderia sp. AcTa6-5]